MITLGIDPSLTSLGWCVHRSDVVGPGRVLAKGTIGTSSKTVFVRRNMYFRESLLNLLDTYPEIEGVGVESTTFGEAASSALYGLWVYVNEAVFLHRKDVVYFDPKRVKLLAKMDPKVRRGKMDKTDMIEAAKAETNIKQWNGDEADAYIIAREAARFFDFFKGRLQEEELTPAELHVFNKTHTFTRGKRKGRTVKRGIIFKEGDRFFQFSLLGPDDTAIEAKQFYRSEST